MIITESKPLPEVLNGLEGFKMIGVLGCGRCATSCATGGEKQVAEMARVLREHGFKVVFEDVVEAQCDERLTKKTVKKHPEAEACVSMACGSGMQALVEVSGKNVVPANNTLFLGVIKRHGKYDERCSMCGDCMLGETHGVCVVTRCSKGLLNGPCGGSRNGKCEVDESRDCAWALITEKLKDKDGLSELSKPKPARKVNEKSRPRRVDE